MEARHKVRAAVADEHAHGLVRLHLQRLRTGERGLGAVEQDVRRVLIDRLLHVEGLIALLAILADGVEVALHHVELAIDLRQSFRRLNQNEAIHAVRDVHADRRGRAVVDVETLIQRLEGELRLMPRRREARRGAAAGTCHAVQVDVVRHLARGMILQMELDGVALAHANEAARHGAAERPERVLHAFGNFEVDLFHFEIDDDFRGIVAVRRRRHFRRTRQDRLDRLALRRTEIPLFRTARVGRRIGGRDRLLRFSATRE